MTQNGGACWRDAFARLSIFLKFIAFQDIQDGRRRYGDAAVLGHDTLNRLPSLRMPTMLVRAGRDILIDPSRVDAIAAAIPDARVVRFDDAGHGLTYECAAALNDALLDHFAAADASAQPQRQVT